MKLSSRLLCGVLAAAYFAAAQTPPASETQQSAAPAGNRPAAGRATCPAGAAWFCVTQTLQHMMFNLNGTHKPDAEIAAQVPRAIAQMIKDGVMKTENAPTFPITGFEAANKFLNGYPSDVSEPAPVSATAPAPVTEQAPVTAPVASIIEPPVSAAVAAPPAAAPDAPAKSEECPPDRPWLCAVPGAPPGPQNKTQNKAAAQPKREVSAPKVATASKTPAPAKTGAAAAGAAEAPPADGDDMPLYVFGANDVVGVNVFGEREATGTYTIMPDGRMSMPLIGSFKAIGTTVPELTEVIKTKLQDEAGILEPVVNVQLLRNNSKRYTMAGAVMRPGAVPLVQETTLLDALISSGMQEFANKKKVVLRRGTKQFIFNYKDALKGKGMDKNMVLQDGDYIIVAGD